MEELDADFVQAVHSVGHPLAEGEADVKWPCNDTKYIVQFPEERTIWSYGSGYGGNALLGKKCYALRIASVMARDEGWLAEHMLILKLTSPEGTVKYIAAAFPSACGKTNLAMLEPTIPGWKVETLGDDIAWMRIGEDGRLWAVNPEYGFFGVAPGTNEHTNPNAMKTINKGNSVFTNVALTEDGDIWWEGLENPPAKATSWKGEPWTPGQRGAVQPPQQPLLHADQAVRHPRAGVRRPARRPDRRDPVRRPPQDDRPAGLRGPRLDARHVPGRHALLARPPPPRSARSASYAATRWRCCRSSATTPATTSTTGSPWARRTTPSKLPKIFYVNWFRRRRRSGGFLWPGFGENSRVLKWVVERIEGQAAAVETPIGHVPAPGSLDIDGLDMSEEALAAALARRRRGVEGRDPADHGVVREVRRPAARRCCGPSSTA